MFFYLFYIQIFSRLFDTSGSMIPLSVPEIEGGPLSVTEEEKKKDRFGGILGG